MAQETILFVQVPDKYYLKFTNLSLPLHIIKFATRISEKLPTYYLNPNFFLKRRVFQYHVDYRVSRNAINTSLKVIKKYLNKINPSTVVLFSPNESQTPITIKLIQLLKKLKIRIYIISPFFSQEYLKFGAHGVITDVTTNSAEDVINGKGGIIRHPVTQKSLQLPFPDWSLVLNIKKFPPSAFSSIPAGVGCPFHCIFCVSRKTIVRRNPKEVLTEILDIVERFKTREFDISVPSFLFPRQWSLKMIKELSEYPNIIWHTTANVIHIVKEKDLVPLMKRASCISISSGFESGSDRVLKIIRKQQTSKLMYKSVKILKENNILSFGSFLIGFPGETKGDIFKTIEFIRKSEIDSFVLDIVRPRPGTPLFYSLDLKWRKKIVDNLITKGEYTLDYLGKKRYFLGKLLKIVKNYIEKKDKVLILKLLHNKKYLTVKAKQFFELTEKNLIKRHQKLHPHKHN